MTNAYGPSSFTPVISTNSRPPRSLKYSEQIEHCNKNGQLKIYKAVRFGSQKSTTDTIIATWGSSSKEVSGASDFQVHMTGSGRGNPMYCIQFCMDLVGIDSIEANDEDKDITDT